MRYSGLVIGLGQIGMGYDYKFIPEKYILTHAQALEIHPEFDLIAGIDISKENRKLFKEKYKKPSFSEINSEIQFINPEIVVISVSTTKHYDTMKYVVSKLSPKLILIEKPLSYSFNEAKEIVNISIDNDIIIAVNHIREFEPVHRKLFQRRKIC